MGEMMRRPGIIPAVGAVLVIASFFTGEKAAHADVAIGASVGYSHRSFPDTPNIADDVIGIPSTTEWGQPGIRVGYLTSKGRWDLNTDIGMMHRSGTIGHDETTAEVMPQLQVNGRGRAMLTPFVNGGIGIVHESAVTPFNIRVTATRPVLGVGLGVRKSVSDGHGLLRIEVRYDHRFEYTKEMNPSETFVFLATNLYSIKLGLDLLVAR
jgi:hypothetical protein